MGNVAYVVNHTKKQFFCCYSSKWGEVFLNPHVMYGIIEFIRSYWNNCQLQFTDDRDLDKLSEYKEVEPCWKEYRKDYK